MVVPGLTWSRSVRGASADTLAGAFSGTFSGALAGGSWPAPPSDGAFTAAIFA